LLLNSIYVILCKVEEDFINFSPNSKAATYQDSPRGGEVGTQMNIQVKGSATPSITPRQHGHALQAPYAYISHKNITSNYLKPQSEYLEAVK
jgi:hypothetical protein